MRKINILLVAALSAGSALAAPVSPSRAQVIASGLFQRHGAAAPAGALTLAVQAVADDGMVDYYVFNRQDNGGYVIVAGDDLALPVLGYSTRGTFTPGDIPCGMEYLLEVYSAEMRELRGNPAAIARRSQTLSEAVEPMLTSHWSQDAPYNNMVPTIGNKRCYTGCVATAISQVMYYYKWPEQGTGSKSYKWKYTQNGQSVSQTLTANFAESTYDWANMLDSYTAGSYNDTQADAVALLLKDVGYAVSMTYGTSSSGAADTQQAPALRNYFSYPEATWERHVNYEQEEWEDMIRAEIVAGRPVVFNGATPSGAGHSFVIDGCDTQGLFHVNWGWAGQSDGYFAVSSMNPSNPGIGGAAGGYSQSQTIVTHINRPDPENAEVYTKGFANAFYPVKASLPLGETAAAMRFANYQVNGYGVSLANLYAVARVYNEAETEVIYDYENKSNGSMVLGALYNWSTNFQPREDLPVGKYHIKGAYKLDQNEEVTEYFRPLDSLNYVLMEVREDGIAYFSSPAPAPCLIQLEMTAETASDMMQVEALVKNTGTVYSGQLKLTLETAEATATSARRISDVPATIEIDDVTIRRSEQQTVSAGFSVAGLPDGVYALTLIDKDGNVLGDPVQVTIDRLTGVTCLTGDVPTVSVGAGVITVNNARAVAVYDMTGRQVSRQAVTTVPAGTYVVVADGAATRVLVK